MKNLLKIVGLASVVGFTAANAALAAPDFTDTITDMGTAFTAILTLVVAGLGYKFVRRMFT